MDYLDRNNNHSIIAQAVVDHRGLFRDVSVGVPGSAHDMLAFKNSSLNERISQGNIVVGNDYLVADSGYYCRRFMIPPYDQRRSLPTPNQRDFNKAHAQTRGIVERSFGHVATERALPDLA
jgi:hypothetical protein